MLIWIMCLSRSSPRSSAAGAATPARQSGRSCTPNLPTNMVPTKIARLKLSGKSPMDLGIPPLKNDDA